ncbi:MAG: alpha-amylase family glycosyl hydrolase [Candidatus Erginobacter occultus]|nr:alpha-amylase family glycosyl hydrolase [Candidatus Erginobacter occultus]
MKKPNPAPPGPAPGVFSPSPFRLHRRTRNRCGLGPPPAGPAVPFDFAQAMAESINRYRDAPAHPEMAVRAGEVSAICLIEAVTHYLSGVYHLQENPGILSRSVTAARRRFGSAPLEKVLVGLIETLPGLNHPPPEVAPGDWLERGEGSPSPREEALTELMLFHLSANNPAFRPLGDFFPARELEEKTSYPEVIRQQEKFYLKAPPFGPEKLPLPEFLRRPVEASPDSLAGQLDYIRKHWIALLPPELRQALALSRDLIREEEKLRLAGPGPVRAPGWSAGPGPGGEGGGAAAAGREIYDRFSPDLDWMPRVVLMVKNAAVWMSQLSRRYRREITRLDGIPDEELDTLARWGFTSLWLIGIWERSAASKQIKRLCGNPEADASAYSLNDYAIAGELGGWPALNELKRRAWKRGIRVACDMVPNHMGLDSRWVVEHPGWFIQTDRPPFPNYRFTGPDLSSDPRVAIRVEDGYWKRSDAAVVFQQTDRAGGRVRYIYHGNDGTSMPWNDTAQLNFLIPEVREAVIRTIIHVARVFPVIRFDAAMVLAKRHFQRLWYPPPGEGGAIPSRSGRGVSEREFERIFPVEFWREVVDRVAKEVPETLLLAEAFWMMEGYFVRTLGMHRVYNSAFMNMLKMEMNDGYRQVIKEVLEFDPQILKRFANFMSNPDEATAIAQFGKGDQYFGVCTMMATMPGLPLFGHGQVEGLTEKYGMEYRRAYWDEPVDDYLVRRHEQEIFPLLKKRHLFSDVANFYLYDFYLDDGRVNEDVFAYSNRYENERSLIIYNNRFLNTAGWIRDSAARAEKGRSGKSGLVRVDLARGLGLRGGENDYTIFQDIRTGLEYIRSSREMGEKGMSLKLRAYQTHVFVDIREVRDDEKGFLSRLAASLKGRGVENINDALKKIHFAPLYQAFREVCGREIYQDLFSLAAKADAYPGLLAGTADRAAAPLEEFFGEVIARRGVAGDPAAAAARELDFIQAVLLLVPAGELPGWTSSRYSRPALQRLLSAAPAEPGPSAGFFRILLTWHLLATTGKALAGKKKSSRYLWMRDWFLGEQIVRGFEEMGCDWNSARRELDLIVILLRHLPRMLRVRTKNHLYRLDPLFRDSEVRHFLLYHWDRDVLWFNRERLDQLLFWLSSAAAVLSAADGWDGERPPRVRGLVHLKAADTLRSLAEESGYRVKEFRRLLAARPRKRQRSRRKKKENTPR